MFVNKKVKKILTSDIALVSAKNIKLSFVILLIKNGKYRLNEVRSRMKNKK